MNGGRRDLAMLGAGCMANATNTNTSRHRYFPFRFHVPDLPRRIGTWRIVAAVGGTLALLGGGAWWYREELRSRTATEVAIVAKQSLERDTLQRQVGALSHELVQQLLADPAIASSTLAFGLALLTDERTRESAMRVLHATLRDEQTQRVLHEVGASWATSLAESDVVRTQLADLVTALMTDTRVRAAAVDLGVWVARDEATQAAFDDAMRAAVVDTLGDPLVQQRVGDYVAALVDDRALQEKTGAALWHAVRASAPWSRPFRWWSARQGDLGGAKDGGDAASAAAEEVAVGGARGEGGSVRAATETTVGAARTTRTDGDDERTIERVVEEAAGRAAED